MSLETFKLSRPGMHIAPILSAPDNIAAMEEKSRAGRPAVEAVGAEIARNVGPLDDQEKQHVGRWVKQVLATRGWVPDRPGIRVAPGHLFARGTIYRRSGHGMINRASGAARFAAAVAILAQSAQGVMSSDELIAERARATAMGE